MNLNLNENYNQEEFVDWIEEFLPDFSRDIRKVDVPGGFTGVKSISTLGESRLGVRIYIIETDADPSRRKVGLATDSFNLLKNYGSPNAIIAYYSKNSDQWRLSLLTSTPIWTDGKIITKLSNPKRQSYVLGSKAKVKTPHQYLLSKGRVVDFADLKSRFSLEVVNKEFYKEISTIFLKLVGGSMGSGKDKKTFKQILKLPSINEGSQADSEFAVRLIGRIIFCWFLREKVSSDGVSLMPKDLLSLDAISKHPDYYHRVLESIFFEVLNKPVKSRKELFLKEPFSLIPYLNGGLFSPHIDDFFSYNEGKQATYHNILTIPDDWLKEFFQTLELYNFTIDENTSFDEELSIDPEMLGRIFENLLAEINPETGESIRKSTGSYYTPRVIVDYMVDESLLFYLKEKTQIEEEKLQAIISYDLADDTLYPLNENEKEKVIDAIERIKILDPACGSGAYPIGGLQKIVFILQQVDPAGQLWFRKQIENTSPEIRRVIEREFSHKNFDYIRKLGVIRENIYGIDIQTIATEISRLRCFLTLVVDERIDDSLENRGIEPLPNLDFKFVTANSLISLPTSDKTNQMGLFEDAEGIKELKEIRDMFFNASGFEREQLKLQFVQSQNRMFQKLINEGRRGHAELTTKLTSWDPFSQKASSWFDSEWMFGISDGFDVVIGNPPYGLLNKKQNQKLGHQVSEVDLKYFKDVLLYKPAQGGMLNAYRLFVCQSLNLLKDNGSISLIFPLAFMCDLSASNLRKYILDTYRIDYLEAFPERDNEKKRVFEAVKMSVCILGASKLHGLDSNFTMRMNKDKYIDLTNKESIISPSIIKNIDPINYTIPLVNPEELKLLSKIGERSERLIEIGKCYTGEIDLTFNKKFLTENSEDSKLIKGAQVQKYKLSDVMSQGEIMYLNESMYKKSTNGIKATHNKLRRIVMQGITGVNENTRLKMTIIEPPIYCANSVNYLILKKDDISLESLLGLLNSKLMNWYFKKMSTNSNVNGYEVDNLPIIKNFKSSGQEIGTLVKEIISSFDSRLIDNVEQKIDQIVYKLYDLTSDEVAVIESR